jgi:two-component system sensor histidine kinase/response regulator
VLTAPLQLALAYAAASALWILFSDQALAAWVTDPAIFALASAIKGWFFIGVTSLLLYALLRRQAAALADRAAPGAASAPAGRAGLRRTFGKLRSRQAALLLVVVCMALAGATATAIIFTVHKHKAVALDRLQAVADAKVQLTSDWLHAREVEAVSLAAGAEPALLVQHWHDPAQQGTRNAQLARLEQIRRVTQFKRVRLLDARGQLLWQSPGPAAAAAPAPSADTQATLQGLATRRQLQRHGPYRDAAGTLHTDFVLPLAPPGLPDGQAAPLLVLHLDGEQYLPPTLLDWPIPSATGEVVLLRRDGDSVIYLSKLRQAPDAALRLRLPLADKQLLGSQMATSGAPDGQVLEGTSYQGVPAFGVGHRVPGTDWLLLAKLDHSELYGVAVPEAIWVLLTGALALFVVAAGAFLAWQRQQLALASQAQEAQREKLRVLGLLAAIADSSEDVIFAKDTEGRYTLFNRAGGRTAGRRPEAMIGLDDHALFPPEQAQVLIDIAQQVMATNQTVVREKTLSTVHGDRFFLSTNGPLRDSSGKVIGVFGISRDITDTKLAEVALQRAQRALMASRECGQAVMRATDEAELLREVCHTVVHTGGYRMCWVGFAEDDAQRTVRPVVHEGPDDGYMGIVQVSWGEGPLSLGPTGTAIRERRPVISRDLATDPNYVPWRDAALARGFAAAAALPLLPDPDTCIGAICIYATDAQAFDDEEVRMVAELASDLAYGIRALRDRQARRETQLLLSQQKDRLAESQRIAHVGSWEYDPATQQLSWSDETFRLHGLEPDDSALTLAYASSQVQPEDLHNMRAWVKQVLAGESPGDIEYRVALPQGGQRILSARCAWAPAAAGQGAHLVGTVQDITQLRLAEAERLAQEARYRELFAANPHPMWVYDQQTLAFIEVNDAAVAKYGYSREEFLGMRIDQIRPAKDVPRLLDHIRHRSPDPQASQIWQHHHKDGRLIDVEISAHALAFGARPAVVVLAHDVTEQRVAQARLHLLAQRADALLQLPDLARSLDETTFMQRAQEVAEDLTGSRISFIHFVNPDGNTIELVTWSRRTLEVFCRASHDRHYPINEAGIWADALRTGKPVIVNDYPTHPHKRGLPEGHAVLDRLVSVPVVENGRVVMITGVGGKASDYTDADVETVQLISTDTWRLVQRRRAEAALQTSEQSYRTLTEQVPAIIYRAQLDDASTTTYISPAVQGLGYTPAQWLADPKVWADSLHPEDRERVFEVLQAAQRSNGNIDVEYRLRTRAGEWRHIHDKADLVHDAQGKPLYLQGLMLDVTQRLRDEVELRKLYQAVEQSPNSIVITNLKAEIEYVNAAFLATTGYSREEIIGRNPRILQAEDVQPGDRAPLWEALTQGLPWKGEFRNRRKDGSHYVELAHVAPLRQPDGRITHYVGVKEDITEKTRIAEELDRYRQHLEELVQERTNALADASRRAEAANLAKSAFLANMSHEIRTPMNAIVGLSYLLQREQLTPRQRERLAKIDTAALHLLSIINGILDLSKIEAGKVSLEQADFALSEVLDAVHALVADRAAAKGVAVQVHNERAPSWLHGDATRLRQALLNYADNALKFTAQGSIWLRARLLEDSADGVLLRLEVQDTGIGIEADELPRLFQAFEQADASTTRKYGGTGLGLALTRRLAHLMGGDTGVDSVLGQGSTFWLTARLQHGKSAPPLGVWLPAAEDTDAVETALRQLGTGAYVLLAEDDPINREVAMELLHAVGIVVDTAIDGHQAVQKASTHAYDLVLMDLQMPQLDGFDATRALRALPGGDHLPVLAMTANAFEEDRQACLAAGMNDFVPKPVDPKVLYATLLRWLPRRELSVGSGFGAPKPEAAAPAPAWVHDDATGPLSNWLAGVQGLDMRRGLDALRGDLPAYLLLLQRLTPSHGHDAELITEHVAAERWKEAQRLTHRLKGAAGALGATALQQAAAALEQGLRQQPGAVDLGALLLALHQESRTLFAALSALQGVPLAPRKPQPQRQALPGTPPAVAGSTDQAPPGAAAEGTAANTLQGAADDAAADPSTAHTAHSAHTVHTVLAELEALLASDDTAAVDLFEAWRGPITARLGAAAHTLRSQLEDFDFAAALATLRQALGATDAAQPRCEPD